jgi:hypothetical protein
MVVYVALLILIDIPNLYGEPPANTRMALVAAEFVYLAFAGVAYWLDRMREPLPEEQPVKLNI